MKSNSNYNFADIASKFTLEGEIIEVKPYGMGHINGTFRLINGVSGYPDYLLQSINSYVFKDVPGLINNVKLITEHLRNAVRLEDGNPATEVLTLVPHKNGEYFYNDDEGNYWRVYLFLHGTKSYDIIETETQAFEGGRAFGKFQSVLSSMDASLLIETISDFHNIKYRLRNLNKAVDIDIMQRTMQCQTEINFITERIDKMCTLLNLGEKGEIPLRITHNDTKFNNILFDNNNNAQCVIDLDTVMPGYIAYDFGDAIRTVINRAAEDEANLFKITLNMPLFQAYTKGYLKEAMHFLTTAELNSLIYGVLLLPYMQAVRFLTDYLDGDRYFKIHFAEHNLQRAKAQLKLVNEIEDHQYLLEHIIEQAALEIKSKQRKIASH